MQSNTTILIDENSAAQILLELSTLAFSQSKKPSNKRKQWEDQTDSSCYEISSSSSDSDDFKFVEPLSDHESSRKRRRSLKKLTFDENFVNLRNILMEKHEMPNLKTVNTEVNRWFDEQCDALEKGTLSKDKLKKFEDLKNEFPDIFAFHRSEERRKTPIRPSKQRFPLSSWIHSQRTLRRKNKLPEWKIAKLDTLGFEWEPMKKKRDEDEQDKPKLRDDEIAIPKPYLDVDKNNQKKWLENFNELKQFKKRYGHLNVPTNKDSAEEMD